ncbi:GreA/GreB family elongation factor [Polluticoccus soli]|uniref:GreA/GreB family elongation factor n=1 Tax=Polluticoccus soli TaxID=3034150 RepID=UPI0023E34D9E|nr:GreA/GreB family elongation factor [Flavipsychrobacter sp. JY13-12]
MTANDQNPVIMTEEDFQLLKPYISQLPEQNSDMTLTHELSRAVIVSKDAFPPHTVRLNSKVSVLDLGTDRVMEFTIVMPAHADMRQNKISVLTPMGTALIGFRKAEEVQWKVPAGLKRFRILDVVNR